MAFALDKTTLTFIVLLGILLIGSYFMQEGFADASGNKDASGSFVTLSLLDLFALFGATSKEEPTTRDQGTKYTKEQSTITSSILDQQFMSSLKDEITKDVRETVRSQLNAQADSRADVLTDSCIDSVANQQGTDWMRYIPGKNPADYIRKDSIPCYSCNLPS